MVVLLILKQQKYFFFVFASNSNFSFSGCSHLGSLFTDEERKGLANDVMYRLPPHTSTAFITSDLGKMSALTAVFFRLSSVDTFF